MLVFISVRMKCPKLNISGLANFRRYFLDSSFDLMMQFSKPEGFDVLNVDNVELHCI